MKKIFLLLIFLSSFLFSAIDECKTDVYFGNGILTKKESAIHNAGILRKAIKKKFGLDYYNKHIGKVDYAYNSTWDRSHDLLESYLQLDTGNAIDKINDEIAAAKVDEELVREIEAKDLGMQIKKYEASIKSGHRVLIVAHSQGALFANRAFELIGKSKSAWMQNYMLPIYVAPASSYEFWKKNTSPSFTFDNDPMSQLAHYFGFPITQNPNKYKKPIVNQWGEKSFVYDKSFVFHTFAYYLGVPVQIEDYDGKRKVQTDVAKTYIMAAIDQQLIKLGKLPSQWQPKTRDNGDVEEEKKCPLNTCDNKRKGFTHRFDPAGMDPRLGEALVYPFGTGEHSRLYVVDGAYVYGPCGGTGIGRKPKDGVCFALEGTDAEIKGKDISGNNSIRRTIDPVSTALSWDKASDVQMDLSMTKSPGGPPNVGDTYTMSARGRLLAESQITAECLKNDPIHVTAYVSTPNDWGISRYEIVDVGQLVMDPYGIVVVEEKQKMKIEYASNIDMQSGGADEGGHSYTKTPRKYNKCKKESAKKSCQCVPCQFMVYGMQRTSQYGPIAGGDVTIISAADDNKKNPRILYHTVTTSDRDTLKSGIIDIDQDAMGYFEDEQYYIVRVAGGIDIDSNDDFVYDDMPTQNHGTIHAILKGKDLKGMPFVVNVLTEAIYQVSGNMIGDQYDPSLLGEMLDRSASMLINTKLDITALDKEINYRDILLWTPAADKTTLFKPYDTYVQPIVEKTYTDMPRSDESYQLIYGDYNSSMPMLMPISVEIQSGLPNRTPIAKVSVQNNKTYAYIEIDGEFADAFEIGEDGLIRIAQSNKIVEGGYYDMRMRAVTASGEYGNWAGLLIRVKGTSSIASSAPILQSVETYPLHENAPAGTKVAKVVFSSVGHAIVAYRLKGALGTLFSIDNDGIVHVAGDIDYETSSSYRFGVVAINEEGAESLPFEIKLPVINELDTPVLPVQMTHLIHENIPIGTTVATIEVLKEGKSPIEHFDILSPNMPFAINKSGEIYTTSPIDYEFGKSYTFMAVASSKHGNSNKIKCTIVVKDVEPEPPKATIDDATFRVDENISKGSSIGVLNIHKSDSPVTEIILSGKDAYAFDVDSSGRLYLSDTIGLDYEKQQKYIFGAKTLDATGYGKEAKIVVEVSNLPDTPPTISGFVATLQENTHYSAKTVIGYIEVRDHGEGNITGYGLTGAQSGLFIVDDNGTVMLKEDKVFDYETKSQYQFFVTATNPSGTSKAATATLNIVDVEDTPPIILDSKLSIEENASKGTKIGVIEVPSIYKKDINFTIVSDPLQVISIDDNGTVYLRQEGILDYEKSTSYLFEVAASNKFGTSVPVQQKVRIINTGTPPVVKPAAIYVPFDRDLVAGLGLGTLKIDNGDGTIGAIVLSGDGSEYFAVDNDGNVTLQKEINLSDRSNFGLKVKASNEFGVSADADVNITFQPKPKIDAGDDIALYANEAFSLYGTIDEAYRDKIKEIRWSSPQTGKINCVETNTTLCKITEGLLPGDYSAIFTVVYQSGWQQTDSLTIKIEPNPFDNVLSVIEKPILGLKKMLFSKDRTKIYAVGDFEGGDIFKIIDVSDPQNIHIIASFAYGDTFVKGEDIALNADETKAAIVANGRLIVLDISDPGSIAMIASRYEYWHQYVSSVEWYRDNKIIIGNWDHSGDYMDTLIVDADTMDVNQTIRLEDGWVDNMRVIAERSLLVYTYNSVLKLYDINQSKIVYKGNGIRGNIIIDENATHVIYSGYKRVDYPKNTYAVKNYFGSLDISDINHIVEREIGGGLLSEWDDVPYRADVRSVVFFSASNDYSVLKELNIDDMQPPSLVRVLQIKGSIRNIIEDRDNQIIYAYTQDGLKAISQESKNISGKYVYRLWARPLISKGGFLYLQGGYNVGNSIYSITNVYRPESMGSITFQKNCYPDCGIENPSLIGAEYMKITGDQMYVVSAGNSVEYWALDTNDKNQTVQLPSKYDYGWSIGDDFVISRDERYIYTRYTKSTQDKTLQGLSVLDLKTNEQNDFVFGSHDYMPFKNMVLSPDEKYLYALHDGTLYVFDIQNRKSIDLLMKTNRSNIRAFVLSEKYNKIYAFADTSIEIYDIETKGTLKSRETMALQSTMLYPWSKTISLSPDESKIVINTKYGIRIYLMEDSGLLNRDKFVDIYDPVVLRGVSDIVWIDKTTLVLNKYIVTLEE